MQNTKKLLEISSDLAKLFDINKMKLALKSLKKKRSLGYNGILLDFLIYSGKNVHRYLIELYNNILDNGILHK